MAVSEARNEEGEVLDLDRMPFARTKGPIDRIPDPVCGFEFHLDGDRAMVLVSGEIDLSSAPRLTECVELLVEQGATRVDFDLRQVAFLDSQGLALLIGCDRRLKKIGGRFRVMNPQPFVRRVFDLAGVSELLVILP